MKDFAKEFYLSPAWRDARAYIYRRDAGLCARCHSTGEIVHHRTPLTPDNITDASVALGADNLELLCRECHTAAHNGNLPTDEGLMFDDDGNVVERICLV